MTDTTPTISKNIVIFTSCTEYWGGSEYLWAQTAELLAQKGYKIHVFKLAVDRTNPQIKKLIELGCELTDLNDYLPSLSRRVWNRFLTYHAKRTLPHYQKRFIAKRVKSLRPALFIISQGVNYDALPYVEHCRLTRIPYVIISQKAIEYSYPIDWTRKIAKKIWKNSSGNYFTCQNNIEITQRQFGIKMDNAEVMQNPISIKIDEPLPWDFPEDDVFRIACPGRYYLLDKGQDLLLAVLAQDKWRARNIELSFYGKGANEKALRDLVNYFDLKNVHFKGHVPDVRSIWKENQALILPSRNEGLPLVTIEAMMCGRVPIVTDVGGHTDIIEDNVTGFIAESANEKSVDEVLERAWQRRNEWEKIGTIAAREIRKVTADDPVRDFAEKLETLIAKSQVQIPE
ncbi:MAG: glycosyltransferase family 4 protein [Pyrinomonadaceae bacterium]